jgi:hypothetical protein
MPGTSLNLVQRIERDGQIEAGGLERQGLALGRYDIVRHGRGQCAILDAQHALDLARAPSNACRQRPRHRNGVRRHREGSLHRGQAVVEFLQRAFHQEAGARIARMRRASLAPDGQSVGR